MGTVPARRLVQRHASHSVPRTQRAPPRTQHAPPRLTACPSLSESSLANSRYHYSLRHIAAEHCMHCVHSCVRCRCSKYHAQWATTLLNPLHRVLYFQGVGGLVLDTSLVELFCAYPGEYAPPPCERVPCPTGPVTGPAPRPSSGCGQLDLPC